MQEAPPRRKARIAGFFFLLTILLGILAEMFISARLVANDAATTANNIVANRGLFQLGFAVYLVEMACQIVMTALFYDLLAPVSRSLSLLAAFFSLVGITIKTLARLFYIAPMLVLTDPHPLGAFNGEQLQALALLFLKVNNQGAGIALVFFGFYALVKGYLIIQSTFWPRILGVLSVLGGVGWLTFLSPPLGHRVFPVVALVGLLGAVSTISWLLIVGVNEERWKEQAREV